MRAFAESTFHPGRQPDTRFTKLIAQMVGGLKRLLPALLARRLQQIDLRRTRFKVRRLHTQQPYRRALFPVSEEKPPYFFINFRVELGRLFERMRARESSEILVAQFQLDGAREISALAQSAANHLAEAHQGRLQAVQLGRVFVVGMFVADGFGIGVFANRAVKPSARILTTRLARQGESPLPKTILQISF